MDTAVALVQACLRVNGYFIVVEYPVLEANRGGQATTASTEQAGGSRGSRHPHP